MFTITSENKKISSSNFSIIQRMSFVLRCGLKTHKIEYPDGYIAVFTPPVIHQETINNLPVVYEKII